jgi:L-malate glycosyltransferase
MQSEKKTVRLLHVDNSIAFTGALKALVNFCTFSKNKIYSVIVIKKGSSCKTILEEHGIKVYELPFIEISKNPLHLLLYFPYLVINAWKIRRIAVREKIDVLHNNDLFNMTLYVTKFIFVYRKPIITHIRMMPASFPAFIYQLWRYINISLADQLIGVSHAVKKAYMNHKKMIVIYNINESPESHPPYHVVSDNKRPFRFIYLANYIHGKGQDYAIQAFELLLRKNTNVTLTFAGGDMGLPKNLKYKSQLMQEVREKNLDKKIFFEDFVKDTELKLKTYDASLNFSYSESFSNVAYESLKFGVPFISSDCGGPAELFVNGESGFLVTNHCVEKMAEAMYQISSNIELRKKFSEKSKMEIHDLTLKQLNYKDLEHIFIKYGN